MVLTSDDRYRITDLINLHGHLVDAGELDRMGEVFTADIEYDVTDIGGGVITGLDALRDASLALGDDNPIGHHVTNIVIGEHADGRVSARSKGIGIGAGGSCASVTYHDTIAATGGGWRISHRKVIAHRRALGRG